MTVRRQDFTKGSHKIGLRAGAGNAAAPSGDRARSRALRDAFFLLPGGAPLRPEGSDASANRRATSDARAATTPARPTSSDAFAAAPAAPTASSRK